MNKSERKELSRLITKYSLCFLVFAFFCVIILFLINKKSMIDNADGLWQQYTYFVSSGKTLQALLKNIFIDHIYELPMWDMTIGMGSDPHIIFNPFASPLLCIISALVPAEYSEYVFSLVVIIRLYLSGLSFLLFVNGKGYKKSNAIAGTMVYVFSSTTFVMFVQMNFSSTFILFPLLLLGADNVWKKNKSMLYVAILTYSTILSFYFTYMMLILLVIYCIIRFCYEKERSLKRFCSLFSRFVGLTLISLCIGFGMILPGLINLSKLSRLKTHYDINLIDFEKIKILFSYGFTCIQEGGDALIGVSSFAVVAAICLLASKKKEPVLKWCLSLCLLSFAFPLVGSVLNGFNYPTIRYIFCLILCTSYLVTVSFDTVKVFKGKIWYISIGASILYCIICLLFIDYYAVISALSLFFSILLTGCINLFECHLHNKREKLYIAVILFSCLIIGYTCIQITLAPSMNERGSVYEKVFVEGGMKLRQEVNSKSYRTDAIHSDFAETVMNSSMAANICGYDFYHSNQNQHIEDYYASLAVLGNPMGFSHTGFRGRCYAEILNACNYIVRPEDKKTCIRAPYSYEYIESDGEYGLYKSGQDVSLVYFYDDVISLDKYMSLDPVSRETNLMYSMVVDEPVISEAEIVYDSVAVPFDYGETKNLIIDGNKIIVQEEGGYISLKPNNIDKGQISVYLSGLRSSDTVFRYRNAVALLDSDNKPVVMDYSAQYSTYDTYYTGNDDIVFSFEAVDEKIDSVALIFFNTGEYYLDDIRIYSRPYGKMDQTVNSFFEHADTEDIAYNYNGNHLNISATSEKDRYLYIAVPYSEGWKATVDGNPIEIIRANIAFMGIPLMKGNHNIEMTYRTPYLYEGFVVSAVGIVLFSGYLVLENIKRKKDIQCAGQSHQE